LQKHKIKKEDTEVTLTFVYILLKYKQMLKPELWEINLKIKPVVFG